MDSRFSPIMSFTEEKGEGLGCRELHFYVFALLKYTQTFIFSYTLLVIFYMKSFKCPIR